MAFDKQERWKSDKPVKLRYLAISGFDLEARAPVSGCGLDVAKSLCGVFTALQACEQAVRSAAKMCHLQLALVNDGCFESGQDVNLLNVASILERRRASIAIGKDVGLGTSLSHICRKRLIHANTLAKTRL